MKQTSVIFTAPLPQKILEGIKTQTRRVVTERLLAKYSDYDDYCSQVTPGDIPFQREFEKEFYGARCKYGKPGDQLWVKETFFAWGRWEARFSEKKKRDEWHFVDLTIQCGESYKYADCPPEKIKSGKGGQVGWWKRPSIFMPRLASRILLEITALRVERLNSISDEDAITEGAKADPCDHARRTCDEIGCYGPTAKNDFQFIWDSIHGEGAWLKNPWVWCITFKVIEGGA